MLYARRIMLVVVLVIAVVVCGLPALLTLVPVIFFIIIPGILRTTMTEDRNA